MGGCPLLRVREMVVLGGARKRDGCRICLLWVLGPCKGHLNVENYGSVCGREGRGEEVNVNRIATLLPKYE